MQKCSRLVKDLQSKLSGFSNWNNLIHNTSMDSKLCHRKPSLPLFAQPAGYNTAAHWEIQTYCGTNATWLEVVNYAQRLQQCDATRRQIIKKKKKICIGCVHTPSGELAAVWANIHVPAFNLHSSIKEMCERSRNYRIDVINRAEKGENNFPFNLTVMTINILINVK